MDGTIDQPQDGFVRRYLPYKTGTTTPCLFLDEIFEIRDALSRMEIGMKTPSKLGVREYHLPFQEYNLHSTNLKVGIYGLWAITHRRRYFKLESQDP